MRPPRSLGSTRWSTDPTVELHRENARPARLRGGGLVGKHPGDIVSVGDHSDDGLAEQP